MLGKMGTRHHLLAELSRRQFGLLTRQQLLNIGFSSSAITRAWERGELAPYLPNVWRVTAASRCWEQRPLGAVLWAGEVTVASHITGAFLHELLPRVVARIEITTTRWPTKRSGIAIHHSSLDPTEMVNIRGIPCTGIYRTLVDLSATQPIDVVESALDTAIRTERVTFAQLREYGDSSSSRSVRGSALFKRLLSVRGEDEALSESEAESRFCRLMRKGRLPIGQRQAPRPGTRGGRLDFYYPDQNLVIEIDGRKFHSGRREQTRDKRYDNELSIGGKRVLRLTWEDITRHEAYTLDLVGRALGIRPLF